MGTASVLSDAEIAALLRLAAREMADTVAPSIAASYPGSVVRALSSVLDEVALAVDRRNCPPSAAPRAADGLEALIAREAKLADDEIAAIAQAQDLDRAAIAKHSTDVALDQVNACLTRTGVLGDARATEIVRLPGGFSKETYLISVDGGPDLVLRRDMPFGPVLGSATDEAGLLASLHARGLPVPRVLLAESDPAILGRAFLLVERVGGENAGDIARGDASAAADIALGLARVLGGLHAIAPVEVGIEQAGDAQAVVRDYLLSWRDYWLDRRLEEAPFLSEAIKWLLNNIPEDVERLVVVHGDARPDNMLALADGTVTALLDWEFKHAGDAAEDVEYAWQFVAGSVSREAFLDAYVAAGGVRYSERNAAFYAIWRDVRNLICLDAGWSGFVREAYPIFSLGIPHTLFRRSLIKDLANAVAALEQPADELSASAHVPLDTGE